MCLKKTHTKQQSSQLPSLVEPGIPPFEAWELAQGLLQMFSQHVYGDPKGTPPSGETEQTECYHDSFSGDTLSNISSK